MYINSKAQIWVETVIYTLVAITLISLVLAFALPAINERRDQNIVESSIVLMNDLSNRIDAVTFDGAGNQRVTQLNIKRGKLVVQPEDNILFFEIEDSKYAASEYEYPLFVRVSGTSLELRTENLGDTYRITIRRILPENVNLTYNGKDQPWEFSHAPTPYAVGIKNNGRVDGKWNIDLFDA